MGSQYIITTYNYYFIDAVITETRVWPFKGNHFDSRQQLSCAPSIASRQTPSPPLVIHLTNSLPPAIGRTSPPSSCRHWQTSDAGAVTHADLEMPSTPPPPPSALSGCHATHSAPNPHDAPNTRHPNPLAALRTPEAPATIQPSLPRPRSDHNHRVTAFSLPPASLGGGQAHSCDARSLSPSRPHPISPFWCWGWTCGRVGLCAGTMVTRTRGFVVLELECSQTFVPRMSL